MYFFFNDTATTEIYTLSLHDALPICVSLCPRSSCRVWVWATRCTISTRSRWVESQRTLPHGCEMSQARSEEHTSELQSRQYLVCRLLLEKKTKTFSTQSSGNEWFRHI